MPIDCTGTSGTTLGKAPSNMDNAKLQELLHEVRQDVAEAERGLEELRRVERYLLSKAEGQPTLFDNVHQQDQRSIGDLCGKTQVDAAEAVLRAAHGPLNTGAIVEAMVARGYQEKGDRKQLENSVFSVMRRRPERFRKVAKGTWALADAAGGDGAK